MLPQQYETPYAVSDRNEVLGKGVRYYAEEIARKNKLLLGKSEDGSLWVQSIARLLRLLSRHGYYAYFKSAVVQPGTATEATFIFEDRNGDTVIQSEVTLVSDDPADFLHYVTGEVVRGKLPKRQHVFR